MANQVLSDLQNEIEHTVGVVNSAVVFINGVAARIQAAVDAALANGASASDLAPVVDEVNALKAASDGLAAAIASNS